MLKHKIEHRKSGILLYGLTPPKLKHPEDKIQEIAQKQVERLKGLPIDGLVLYDLQDESERTAAERPFPFLETLDPHVYSQQYLQELTVPKIVYKCIGKYSEEYITKWLAETAKSPGFSVFVGTTSKDQQVPLSVNQAHELKRSLNPGLTVGGVTIPERHLKKQDEHLRVFNKVKNGCRFFVSQAVYNIEASKNFLSDYYYYAEDNNLEMVPIIFTLTPCGSVKTLQFMEWLGISIPAWLKNDLKYTSNTLGKSINACLDIFEELSDFCLEKKIPIGCNVESVAIRKEEIDASIELLHSINSILSAHVKKEKGVTTGLMPTSA